MNAFKCFRGESSKEWDAIDTDGGEKDQGISTSGSLSQKSEENSAAAPSIPCNLRSFSFAELEASTGNFMPDCSLNGGRVYTGYLTGIRELVAIKLLDCDLQQDITEFISEVNKLSLANHPNLVSLIGFCAEDDHRLLVRNYMPLGSLEDRLHDICDGEPLNWDLRMNIAFGVAKGLEYLHEQMKIIVCNLKCSNILLDKEDIPRISDFGLAKLGTIESSIDVLTMITEDYGYHAPEFVKTGRLTLKTDSYSFGVILLELITGREAFDHDRVHSEQNLVTWAQRLLEDRNNHIRLVDSVLQFKVPKEGVNQAFDLAEMCIGKRPNSRPSASYLIVGFNFLLREQYETRPSFSFPKIGL